jgi:VanZ family protein
MIVVLLRLLADILLYLTVGLLVYWYFIEDITALFIAIASGVISALLFIITTDIKQSRRNRRSEPSSIWDWL